MASSVTLERLQSLFLRELAVIVNKDRKIDGQMYFNITEVRITRDYSTATVYYTILSDEKEDIAKAEEILTKINKQVKYDLSQRVRKIRKIPELKFVFDETLAYGNKIEKILDQLSKEAK
ncbi:MAG: 30S ribosome-binding factor RbfA [Acholeplasmataceae bacterium]|jgi:ribosome-binding factor A|nr:30S ribosome-binding factor RbfA [Acholeplasmataceae bacterium]